MNKRYAIVRVDNVCPNIHDIHYKFVCENSNNFKNEKCNNCRYGDTKEQLVRKIAQALFRRKKKLCEYNFNPNDKFMKEISAKQLKVAKKIVEFLGVE
jgi:hypothetical protein